MGELVISFVDVSDEGSRHKVHLGPINALTIAGVETQIAAYQSAIDGIVEGGRSGDQFIVDNNRIAVDIAALPKACQRETKWLVHFHDDTSGRKFKTEIPNAKLSLLNADGKTLNITSGAGSTWKGAYEDFAVTIDGGAAKVDFVEHVGRNL